MKKFMMKKNLSKKDEQLLAYFDVVFGEYMEFREKYGKDGELTRMEKWKAVGILFSLKTMEIISNDLCDLAMGCFY